MAVIYRQSLFLITTLLLLICGNYAVAQNCDASVGEPIVNITFGAGTSYGDALPTDVTNLAYTAGCPGNGQYTLINRCTTCYTDNWHPITQDHTGNTAGQFMLINAAQQPKDFYVKQVDGLCSGTYYQFSAWVMNMVTRVGTDPNITFSIEQTDGTPIKSFNTGDIPKTANADWQQCAFPFQIPNGISSVVIRMRNNNLDDLGNDLAIDDITFSPMGPPLSIAIQGVAGTTMTVCQDSPQPKLVATIGNCYVNTQYQWQINRENTGWTPLAGANSPIYTVNTAESTSNQYRLVVADNGNIESQNCRVVSNVITIAVNQSVAPHIDIYTLTIHVCTSAPVTFTSSGSGFGPGLPIYDWRINEVTAQKGPKSSFTTSTLIYGQNVSCIVTSTLPCATPALSNFIEMRVSGVPPSVSIKASKTEICKGELVSFTATPGGTTELHYQWLVNGSGTGTNSPYFETQDLKDGDVVDCQVTNVSDCETPVLSTKSIPIRVQDAITSFSISTSPTSICKGQSATFSANPASASSYQWFIKGVLVPNQSGASFTTATLQNDDVVSCRAINGSFCNTPIAADQDITMQVIEPVTTVSVSPSASAVCKGSEVTFTATADQTAGVTYQWQVNGQTVTGDGNKLVRSDLNNNDVVSCRAGVGNCAVPVTSAPVTVTVEDPPQIVLPKTYYEIYQGESVTISSNATGNGITYQWSPNTGLDKADVANPVAHPEETTQYTLLVTSAIGCTQTSEPVTVKVLIKEIVVPNSFTPNNDGINDKWEIAGLSDDPGVQVQVFNRYGASVYYSHGYQSSWDGKLKGKILPSGVYYYFISTTNNKGRKLSGYVTIIR